MTKMCSVCGSFLMGSEPKGKVCNKCLDEALLETKRNDDFTDRLARSYATEWEASR